MIHLFVFKRRQLFVIGGVNYQSTYQRQIVVKIVALLGNYHRPLNRFLDLNRYSPLVFRENVVPQLMN